MRRIELDVHTHTLASGHGYGTIQEMAAAAGEKGLKLLGITEHAAGIPGTCCDLYFKNLAVVPRDQKGVALLLGSEVNILDYEGRLSMAPDLMKAMDLRIAGIHAECYTHGSKSQNTDAVISAISNPLVDVISHPVDGNCPLDYEAVAKAAQAHHVLLEVNNHALRGPRLKDPGKNTLEMLKCCRKLDLPVIMGSDAHHMCDIANFDHALAALAEAEYPEELVMNYSADAFLTFLRENRQRESD
ncbi:MAG: phosphatase [Oscillospiraceae bacterium]|nr:phosphatase [Oscillospiraceae bacterium]